jgi:hypothetical protein
LVGVLHQRRGVWTNPGLLLTEKNVLQRNLSCFQGLEPFTYVALLHGMQDARDLLDLLDLRYRKASCLFDSPRNSQWRVGMDRLLTQPWPMPFLTALCTIRCG